MVQKMETHCPHHKPGVKIISAGTNLNLLAESVDVG